MRLAAGLCPGPLGQLMHYPHCKPTSKEKTGEGREDREEKGQEEGGEGEWKDDLHLTLF